MAATPAFRAKRSRAWLAILAVPIAGVWAFVHFRAPSAGERARRDPASSGFLSAPAVAQTGPTTTADEVAPSSSALPVSSPVASLAAGARGASAVKRRNVKGERAAAAAAERDTTTPSGAAAAIGPSPIAESLAAPQSLPVAPSPSPPPVRAPAASPVSAPAAAAPAYDVQTARVVIGLARNAVGTTPASVTRAVAEASPRITACYKAALPQLNGAIEGAGVLHIDTDGAGIITEARLSGAIRGSVASCVAAAVQGHRVGNVDTGSASGDVPLSFKAH